MNKTATEVVLELVAGGMEKEAGILTSPIRRFMRSLTRAGRELNKALDLRAGRDSLNKSIADNILDVRLARRFNASKRMDKPNVLLDYARKLDNSGLYIDDIYALWNKYNRHRANIRWALDDAYWLKNNK